MKVIGEIKLSVITQATMPEEVSKKWRQGTTSNAETANNRRKEKIKNYNDYEAQITETSNRKYTPYINPDFVSKKGLKKNEIVFKHYKNSAAGYQKYKNKLDYMFETVDGVPTKRYNEKVERMTGHYGDNVAKKLLAFTGTKVNGLGCVVDAIRWMDGETTFAKNSTVIFMGGSSAILARPGLRSSFRSALEQRLLQAGSVIQRSDFDRDIMKKQNDTTNDLMNALTNPAMNLVPFETGGASRVDYELDDSGMFHIH
ncbi:MAG: hypothetical protein AB1599_08170, partial [Planctomycetota bacterium]